MGGMLYQQPTNSGWCAGQAITAASEQGDDVDSDRSAGRHTDPMAVCLHSARLVDMN